VNLADIENKLTAALGLENRPVAVMFPEAVPDGVGQFEGTVPSGCSFWRLAQAGRVFWTSPADHYNCPIGSYTHSIDLPAGRASELSETLGLMVQIGYLKMEEVPGIPRLPKSPPITVYAPLAEAPLPPDAVIFSGKPGRVMMLQEAAMSAGLAAQFPLLGRPTCMSIPAAMSMGAVASSGCIGNRVYTDLDEGDLYVTVPGKDLERLAMAVDQIVEANRTLETYHRERRSTLATV
jgi:uncharacterized protein (DUF169 family)